MALSVIDEAIVCFIDILGFRNMVTAAGDRLELANRLDAAIEKALEAFGGKDALRGTPDAEWRVRIFSDCLCAAKPLSPLGVAVALEAVSTFTQEMLVRSLPIRGGIAIGPYAESELLLFSTAQIAAYDLESKVARHPRVVLSASLLGYINAIADDEYRWLIKELIILDRGRLAFVNYMIFYEEDDWLGGYAFYDRMSKVLAAMLRRPNISARVREKYLWMAALHNWSLVHTARLLKQSGILSEDTVWNFRSFYIESAPAKRRFRALIASDAAFAEMTSRNKWMVYSGGQMVETFPENRRKGIDWLREWPGASTVDDEKVEDDEDEGDATHDYPDGGA
ncbi:MAG: hypothetical protein JWN58_846 [Gammaproteobacteria bacterium]|nr:hypothetical protein [Gammaproteobacteria bacterium]